MTDYLTALAAVLDSLTRPEFAIIVGPIAVVAGLFIWAEYRADKIRRAREELTAATLHHVTRCGARSPEGWFCDRARAHGGVHTDSTKGGELGSARWFGVGGAA